MRDVGVVKARLEAADVLVSDAGVYAMAEMRQISVLDPSAPGFLDPFLLLDHGSALPHVIHGGGVRARSIKPCDG